MKGLIGFQGSQGEISIRIFSGEYIDELDVPDLVKYINNYEDKNCEVKCKVCHARELTTLFLPCKHLLCCSICADKCGKCCVCKRDIESTLKVIIS